MKRLGESLGALQWDLQQDPAYPANTRTLVDHLKTTTWAGFHPEGLASRGKEKCPDNILEVKSKHIIEAFWFAVDFSEIPQRGCLLKGKQEPPSVSPVDAADHRWEFSEPQRLKKAASPDLPKNGNAASRLKGHKKRTKKTQLENGNETATDER